MKGSNCNNRDYILYYYQKMQAIVPGCVDTAGVGLGTPTVIGSTISHPLVVDS